MPVTVKRAEPDRQCEAPGCSKPAALTIDHPLLSRYRAYLYLCPDHYAELLVELTQGLQRWLAEEHPA